MSYNFIHRTIAAFRALLVGDVVIPSRVSLPAMTEKSAPAGKRPSYTAPYNRLVDMQPKPFPPTNALAESVRSARAEKKRRSLAPLRSVSPAFVDVAAREARQ